MRMLTNISLNSAITLMAFSEYRIYHISISKTASVSAFALKISLIEVQWPINR